MYRGLYEMSTRDQCRVSGRRVEHNKRDSLIACQVNRIRYAVLAVANHSARRLHPFRTFFTDFSDEPRYFQ